MDMHTWLIIICISLFLKPLFTFVFPSSSKPTKKLPPGPHTLPFIAKNFIWNRKSFLEFVPIISSLRHKYGPLITVYIGSKPTIFVNDSTLSHQALVQNAAVFADRPKSIGHLIYGDQRKGISWSPYGPAWRALRRNLTGGVLHPTRLKSYSHMRKRVLDSLIDSLTQNYKRNEAVFVFEHFHHTVISLLVLMCFGDNVNGNQIKEFEDARNRVHMDIGRLKLFILMPKLAKILFPKRWNEHLDIVKSADNISQSFIKARKEILQERKGKDLECMSYTDTLLDLQVSSEEGNLEDGYIEHLCGEFISAGTDSTANALQWIMANIVKYPSIQSKLFAEIKGVVGTEQEFVKEDDLQNMPYLKAVILEGLRRHPPAHLTFLGHSVTQSVEFGGYVVPKGTAVDFLIADMGLDPNVWDSPMEFKPERFLCRDDNGGVKNFDITGSREIRMMPFGAGRRICPGYGLAMLHLEYFVANLVWHFEWMTVDGNDVDLSAKGGIITAMKNPLRAQISPRIK